MAINSKAVSSIMNSRTLVSEKLVGRTITITVQGNGNTIEVKNKKGENVETYNGGGELFEKRIFNTKSNSEIAMRNPRNRQLLKDAMAAEKAGDSVKAEEIFNEYLNKVQLSFSIPLPSKIADAIGNNDEVSAKVVKVTTDKGELLTIDPKTIKVLEPEVLGNTKFELPKDEDDAEAVEAEAALEDAAEAAEEAEKALETEA